MEKSFAFVIQLQAFEMRIKGKMFDLLNEQNNFWGAGVGVRLDLLMLPKEKYLAACVLNS